MGVRKVKLHNRSIKVEFWTDTDLMKILPTLAGRHIYLGLIQLADDSGCLEDDVTNIKYCLCPMDMEMTEDKIRELLDNLIKAGKVVPYEAGGKRCLWIKRFYKHQSLRTPGKPEVPLPEWIDYVPSGKKYVSGYYVTRDPETGEVLCAKVKDDEDASATKALPLIEEPAHAKPGRSKKYSESDFADGGTYPTADKPKQGSPAAFVAKYLPLLKKNSVIAIDEKQLTDLCVKHGVGVMEGMVEQFLLKMHNDRPANPTGYFFGMLKNVKALDGVAVVPPKQKKERTVDDQIYYAKHRHYPDEEPAQVAAVAK